MGGACWGSDFISEWAAFAFCSFVHVNNYFDFFCRNRWNFEILNSKIEYPLTFERWYKVKIVERHETGELQLQIIRDFNVAPRSYTILEIWHIMLYLIKTVCEYCLYSLSVLFTVVVWSVGYHGNLKKFVNSPVMYSSGLWDVCVHIFEILDLGVIPFFILKMFVEAKGNINIL